MQKIKVKFCRKETIGNIVAKGQKALENPTIIKIRWFLTVDTDDLENG